MYFILTSYPTMLELCSEVLEVEKMSFHYDPLFVKKDMNKVQ